MEEFDPRKCPTCGELAIVSCRCPKLDCRCKNGHEWHTCVKHKRLVLEMGDHSASNFGCSCGTGDHPEGARIRGEGFQI